MGKTYSLLVGIDSYPKPYALQSCTSDVEKISSYLSALHKNDTDGSSLSCRALLNAQATKQNIVKELELTIPNLTDDDLFLFYFSGHGVIEESLGRFKDDHNGTLQSCVCYHNELDERNFLLSNKEIRYLLGRCTTKAHVIALFDCCHSGDITRSVPSLEEGEFRVKALPGKFPQRQYDEFIFHDLVKEETFQSSDFNQVFTDGSFMAISACMPNQSAWENRDGGVFTSFLLETLQGHDNAINYTELVKQVDISIRLATPKRQTPTIDVHGDRIYNQLSSWLLLHGIEFRRGPHYIKYNKNLGWILPHGTVKCK